jgi:predicted AlkP superfamily phosphohydrolase/phosphomutase
MARLAGGASERRAALVGDGEGGRVASSTMSSTDDNTRAFVLGLDGVPWRLLQQWASAGELEHVSALFSEGAAGPLESTTPATTPLAWPSIATGTRPDKHGVYGFRELGPDYTHRMNTAEAIERPALWDVLSPAVVANVPMTYPASEIDGAMVSGMMTPSIDDGFAHPSDLRAEIDDRLPDYEIGLDWKQYGGSVEAFTADLRDLVAARRELMRLLMEREPWRLFFFVYTAPDRLQHLAWDEEVLLDHYRLLDDVLGEVMDYADERDATLFVVSDHGFGPISKEIAVNDVLLESDYLAREQPSGMQGVFSRLGITKDAVMGTLERIGIDDDTLVTYVPQSLTDRVANRIPGDHVLYDVEYGETTAFVHELGNVYVNDTRRFEDGRVDPADVPAVKRELTSVFSELTDPETGERALDVYDGDALFPTDPESPDLVVQGRDGYEIASRLTGEPFVGTGDKAASHRSEGVFLAWGPDVEAGTTPEGATVYDVAPTLLHCLGDPLPEGTDGRVLDEVFAPNSTPGREAPRTRQYEQRGERADHGAANGDVEERLRGLGYLN